MVAALIQTASVAAPKISSIVKENFGPKHWIFPKFCQNIQKFGKNYNFKILTKRKISESIVYVISQLIFSGGREIAGKEAKYCQVSQNFMQNFGKILWVQYFTKIAILQTAARLSWSVPYIMWVLHCCYNMLARSYSRCTPDLSELTIWS